MLNAISGFLKVVLYDEPPSVADLSRSLDVLALAYHDTPRGDPVDNDTEAPAEDYLQDYLRTLKIVRRRFPDLGYYGVVDPLELKAEEWLCGDAGDDLSDIIGDLTKVKWRHDAFGIEDAHWHFRFLFEIHWGRHLRELQMYLHCKQFYGKDQT